MAKASSGSVCSGNIDTGKIYETHTQIKDIITSYKTINKKVENITNLVNSNWVGEGHNEFETQYELLIKKIDDFGDVLEEIYDALVEAEADYEELDNTIRQNFVME